MSDASLCIFCGAPLKEKARRCSSCSMQVEYLTTHFTPTETPDSPITDCALSKKLIPLNRKRQLFFTLGIIFFIPAFIIATSRELHEYFDSFRLIPSMLLLFAVSSTSFYLSRQYTNKKKTLIGTHLLHAMLAEQFELYHFDPLAYFLVNELNISQLRPGLWNATEGNDLFHASYRGVTFHFSNIRLFDDTQSRYRNSNWRLKGQWLILDLHKEIPAPLMISELEHKGRMGKDAKIETGNPDFDKRFTVLCEHPAVVPQVLTGEFMEFLLHFDCIFAYNQRHIFFKENAVHIGIKSDRYLFSPWSYIRDIPALRERILDEMDDIKKVIDGFLLINALFRTSVEQDFDKEEK